LRQGSSGKWGRKRACDTGLWCMIAGANVPHFLDCRGDNLSVINSKQMTTTCCVVALRTREEWKIES
jgi:hypothetical protein